MPGKSKEKKQTKIKKKEQERRLLQEALDLLIAEGGTTAGSRESGIPRKTLDDRVTRALEQDFQPSAKALRAAGLKKPQSIPLSEDDAKYKDWTAAQCITELKRIAAESTASEAITRHHFRVFSTISESTWNKHFGTFLEFKRQAGLILTRHQHRHERDIAKHAAADVARDLTLEKRGYAGKYDKPEGGRWQTILVGSDLHDVDCDPFFRRLFVEAAQRVQPNVICLNGDIFDLPEFSKYTQDPRDWDVVGRIEWVHALLNDLREAAPDAQIDLIEGNHEFRMMRHLAEATPALRTILSDLHGFTVARLLGLDTYEVNYVARCDLAAWTERDVKEELRANWVNYWDAVIAHHFPEGRQMGYPGWNGHHHRHIVWHGYNPTHGAYEWHQVGAGHMRDASYTNGEKWTNGLMLAHVDTRKKHTAFEYVDIRDHAVLGGTWYRRQKSEIITPH